MRKTSRSKKPKPTIIKLGLEVSSPLVSAAVEIERINAALPKADRRIKGAETALANAQAHKAGLIARHNELSAQVNKESRLKQKE